MSKAENNTTPVELSDTAISRVAVKAPPFWDSDAELWFHMLESQFFISGIKDELTKFHIVIASLDAKILSCCRDLVHSVPNEKAYSVLKSRILEYFAKSEQSKLNLLLHDLTLGDKKPSQLLNEMLALSGSSFAEEVLKNLWFQRLPNNMQQILSACKDSLKDLAVIADKVNEISGCSTVLASVNTEISASNIETLRAEISSLKLEVQRLSRTRDRNTRSYRSKSRSGNRSLSRDGRLKYGRLCWYHKTFAKKAQKCVSPCQWQEN